MTPLSRANAPMTSGTVKFLLRMLGGFELAGPNRAPVELPARKTRLLLAYLANPLGQVHARDKLAALFLG